MTLTAALHSAFCVDGQLSSAFVLAIDEIASEMGAETTECDETVRRSLN